MIIKKTPFLFEIMTTIPVQEVNCILFFLDLLPLSNPFILQVPPNGMKYPLQLKIRELNLFSKIIIKTIYLYLTTEMFNNKCSSAR